MYKELETKFKEEVTRKTSDRIMRNAFEYYKVNSRKKDEYKKKLHEEEAKNELLESEIIEIKKQLEAEEVPQEIQVLDLADRYKENFEEVPESELEKIALYTDVFEKIVLLKRDTSLSKVKSNVSKMLQGKYEESDWD